MLNGGTLICSLFEQAGSHSDLWEEKVRQQLDELDLEIDLLLKGLDIWPLFLFLTIVLG